MVWWLWNPMMGPMNPFLNMALPSAQGSASGEVLPRDHLSTLARHGTQACCMWTQDDGFYHFSDNWVQVTGLMPADCMGLGWSEAMHPDTIIEWNQAVHDLMSTDPCEQVPAITIECKIARGDGYWGWQQLTLVPVHMGHRQVISVLVGDLSEKKELEQTVASATRETELAQAGRASFLSNMSHELRTPLNAILGFAQMLQMNDSIDRDSMVEYLTHIRESGEDLLVKITDLIELANIDNHSATLYDEVLNLSDVIDAAMEMYSHPAFQRSITLCKEMDCPAVVIRADRTKMIHVISHLLSNAVHHSASNQRVVLRVCSSATDGVVISIHDKGAGIDDAMLRTIRDSLRGTRSYYATDMGNIRLGLSVAKEFTQLHGGNLSIESVKGQGTIATIHLPAERIVSLSAKVKPKKREFA